MHEVGINKLFNSDTEQAFNSYVGSAVDSAKFKFFDISGEDAFQPENTLTNPSTVTSDNAPLFLLSIKEFVQRPATTDMHELDPERDHYTHLHFDAQSIQNSLTTVGETSSCLRTALGGGESISW